MPFRVGAGTSDLSKLRQALLFAVLCASSSIPLYLLTPLPTSLPTNLIPLPYLLVHPLPFRLANLPSLLRFQPAYSPAYLSSYPLAPPQPTSSFFSKPGHASHLIHNTKLDTESTLTLLDTEMPLDPLVGFLASWVAGEHKLKPNNTTSAEGSQFDDTATPMQALTTPRTMHAAHVVTKLFQTLYLILK